MRDGYSDAERIEPLLPLQDFDLAEQRSRMEEHSDWWALCPNCGQRVVGKPSEILKHAGGCRGA